MRAAAHSICTRVSSLTRHSLCSYACVSVKLERCTRLEREGEQVLSSLANVSERLPLLLRTSQDQEQQQLHNESRNASAMGILSYCVNTQSLLLQKHFASMEKSLTFLKDIVREFADMLRRMKSFASEFMDLLDQLDLEDDVAYLSEQLEWMENVLRMHEREVLRKRVLVADVEYHDAARISRMYDHWSAKSVQSNVDHSYGEAFADAGVLYGYLISHRAGVCFVIVQAGLETLPVIPKPAPSGSEPSPEPSSKSKSQKKKSKSKR